MFCKECGDISTDKCKCNTYMSVQMPIVIHEKIMRCEKLTGIETLEIKYVKGSITFNKIK